MSPTKLSSYYLLTYVLNLCPLLSFIVAPWVDPPLKCSDCCPFYVAHFISWKQFKRDQCPQTPKAVWVISEGGLMGHGPSSSPLVLPLQVLFSGLRTKAAGLKPSLRQSASLSRELSKTIRKISSQFNILQEQLNSLAAATSEDGICTLLHQRCCFCTRILTG